MPALAVDLTVTRMLNVYPGIDPKPHFARQTNAGKVILVAGASRGIRREIALFYAKTGAFVSLVSRDASVLRATKTRILNESPNAKVAVFLTDATQPTAVKAAGEGTVAAFGRLDIGVANAGKINPWDAPFTENDPEEWWSTVETNLRGIYNTAHFALPELAKSNGYIITLTSAIVSKFALHRLTEYIPVEHPSVKSFALEPGCIKTDMTALNPGCEPFLIDTRALPAATCLRLTSGREDWLSGRYVSANWNLDEVEEQWKGRILEEDALVNRLCIPSL